LSECGAVAAPLDSTEKYTAYTGTACDLKMAQQWDLPILDVPLSFLPDTLKSEFALKDSTALKAASMRCYFARVILALCNCSIISVFSIFFVASLSSLLNEGAKR
jgi:uncharacterized protein HI_0650